MSDFKDGYEKWRALFGMNKLNQFTQDLEELKLLLISPELYQSNFFEKLKNRVDIAMGSEINQPLRKKEILVLFILE